MIKNFFQNIYFCINLFIIVYYDIVNVMSLYLSVHLFNLLYEKLIN